MNHSKRAGEKKKMQKKSIPRIQEWNRLAKDRWGIGTRCPRHTSQKLWIWDKWVNHANERECNKKIAWKPICKHSWNCAWKRCMSVPETSTYKPQGKRPCGCECPDLEQLHHEDLLKDISQGHREKCKRSWELSNRISRNVCSRKIREKKTKKKHSLERHAEGDPTKRHQPTCCRCCWTAGPLWTRFSLHVKNSREPPTTVFTQAPWQNDTWKLCMPGPCKKHLIWIPSHRVVCERLVGDRAKNEGNPHCLRGGVPQKCKNATYNLNMVKVQVLEILHQPPAPTSTGPI